MVRNKWTTSSPLSPAKVTSGMPSYSSGCYPFDALSIRNRAFDARKFKHVSEDGRVYREEALVYFEEVRISSQNDISLWEPKEVVRLGYVRRVSVLCVDVHNDLFERQRGSWARSRGRTASVPSGYRRVKTGRLRLPFIFYWKLCLHPSRSSDI